MKVTLWGKKFRFYIKSHNNETKVTIMRLEEKKRDESHSSEINSSIMGLKKIEIMR